MNEREQMIAALQVPPMTTHEVEFRLRRFRGTTERPRFALPLIAAALFVGLIAWIAVPRTPVVPAQDDKHVRRTQDLIDRLTKGIEKYRTLHYDSTPPAGIVELVKAMKDPEESYCTFEPREVNDRGEAVDAWGRPLVYVVENKAPLNLVEVYSFGPNGRDERGAGDDLRSPEKYGELIASFTAALAKDPNGEDSIRCLAQRAYLHSMQAGIRAWRNIDPLPECEKALADYDAILQRTPNAEMTLLGRAAERLALGRYLAKAGKDPTASWNLALDDCGTLIRMNPRSPDAISQRVTIHRAMGQDEAAHADLGRLIELQPGTFQPHLNRANFRRDTLKDYVGAIADYTQALAIDPGRTDAWTGRGMAYMAAGNRDEAIRDFKRSLEINPFQDQAKAKLEELRKAR